MADPVRRVSMEKGTQGLQDGVTLGQLRSELGMKECMHLRSFLNVSDLSQGSVSLQLCLIG